MVRQKNAPSRFPAVFSTVLTALLAALLFLSSPTAAAPGPGLRGGDLAVYVIDVGEGDATLVKGPDGTTMLIDGGSAGQGPAAILPLMQSLGISRLDYMVATHYDDDHIGGLDEVANGGYFPGTAYDRGDYGGTPGTTAYYQYASAIASVRRTIAPGDVIPLGGGATATCLVVNGELMGGGSVDILSSSEFENSACVGLLIESDDFQYLTLGDLTGGGFGTADVEGPVGAIAGNVDVLHVSHHGSSSSSKLPFIQEIQPDLALISVGADNQYGHPTRETLDNLSNAQAAIPILQTTRGIGNLGGADMGGTFLVVTDGSSYRVEKDGKIRLELLADEDGTASPGPGDLVVSEYMNNPAAVSDSYGEYFEIFNASTEDLSLRGIEVRDDDYDSFIVASNVIVPAGERFLYGACGHPDKNGGFDAGAVWPYHEFYLGNGADEIILMKGSVEVEGIRYDGGAAFPDPTGASVERIDFTGPSTGSNFAEAAAPFGAGDLGTPGAKNSADATDYRPRVVERGDLAPGGNLVLSMHAYSDELDRGFAALSMASAPGFSVNGVHVPLNYDGLFRFAMGKPGLFDDLDTFGKGTASLAVPPDPGLSGMIFYTALVIAEPPSGVTDASDAALELTIR